eukprot:TRINITY_DN2206_c0_g1_i11.p1 TRINITY_DN2206_c0_g1~~TRINITY_DN2206_c0_g1_i11.p1  ORF type:complete len:339 (+),score=86.73 TRINITY_DN2206_c0_g1_i11:2-1018(+)
MIARQRALETWYKLERSFNVPRAAVFMRIEQVGIKRTPAIQAKFDLLLSMLRDELDEALFDGSVAGGNFGVSALEYGLELKVESYSESVGAFVDTLIERIQLETMTDSAFALAQEKITRNYQSRMKASPIERAFLALDKLLRDGVFMEDEMIEAVNNVTLEQIVEMRSEIFTKPFIKMFSAGNIWSGDAERLMARVTDKVPPAPLYVAQLPRKHEGIVDLSNQSLVYRAFNENPEEVNHVIINYYQLGKRQHGNWTEYSKLFFLNSMMRNDAFDYLRTKNQLGYIVQTRLVSHAGVDGLVILIQGTAKTPDVMEKYIERFLEMFGNMAIGLSTRSCSS